MLEIMTQLPVQMIAVIDIGSLFSLKNKLPKFLNVSAFYDVDIPCLNEDPKKRPNAKQLFTIFHTLMAVWIVAAKTFFS